MKHMFPVPVLGAVASLAVSVYSFGQQPQVQIHVRAAAPNPAQVVAVGRTIRGEVADLFQRQDPGGGSSLMADLRTDTGQIVSVDLGKSSQISLSPQPVRGEWLE